MPTEMKRVPVQPPKGWPLVTGNFYIYQVSENDKEAIIVLERSTGTLQRAYERVEELRKRDITAFCTTKLIKTAFM
jgi:ribosomal protein S2